MAVSGPVMPTLSMIRPPAEGPIINETWMATTRMPPAALSAMGQGPGEPGGPADGHHARGEAPQCGEDENRGLGGAQRDEQDGHDRLRGGKGQSG